ncbi:phosphoglucomutase [Clostridium cochlearium]|nr:phosphoglucomutase [Clostridium cochlearium]
MFKCPSRRNKKLGGKPFFYKTGHSLIKAKMQEINSPFTGEMSGHMFFRDEYYGFDDALYATARLLRILSNTDKSLGELFYDIPKYFSTPEIRIPCKDEEKFQKVEKAKKYFKEKNMDIITIDGVRVNFKNGWGLIRASNTGEQLILRCESRDKNELKLIKRELKKALI